MFDFYSMENESEGETAYYCSHYFLLLCKTKSERRKVRLMLSLKAREHSWLKQHLKNGGLGCGVHSLDQLALFYFPNCPGRGLYRVTKCQCGWSHPQQRKSNLDVMPLYKETAPFSWIKQHMLSFTLCLQRRIAPFLSAGKRQICYKRAEIADLKQVVIGEKKMCLYQNIEDHSINQLPGGSLNLREIHNAEH